jgi:hypothetical protein
MQQRFPVRARIAKVWKGEAIVACTSDNKGDLNCRTIAETPRGLDFGRAAEIVMEHTRVRTIDNTSPAGRTFRYGLKFGRWEAPDRYQPNNASLKWQNMPSFKGWALTGMKMGDVWSANFSCTARADGGVDCKLLGAKPNTASFKKAALGAMSLATVTDRDGGSPKAGAHFDYTLKVMRLNWCGTGRYTVEGPGAGASAGINKAGGGGSMEFSEVATKGPFNSTDRGQVCTAAIAITQ